ncbi:MAG: hypothetical protein U0996_25650 [Planctomycetaceae bacterium]
MPGKRPSQSKGPRIGPDSRGGWVRPLDREVNAQPVQSKRISIKAMSEMASDRGYRRLLGIARRALVRELSRWRRRKGFVGAAIMEEVDKSGRVAGRPCIRIFVEQTTCGSQMSARQQFPDFVDGIKVQVSSATFCSTTGSCDEDTRVVTSVLDGGDIIRPAHAPEERGTAGLVVWDTKNNQTRYLTAAHVVLGGKPLSAITETAVWNKNEEAATRVVGNMDRASVNYSGTVDCALVTPGSEYPIDHPVIIRCFDGYPSGIRNSTQPVVLHEPVQMFSRKLERVTRGTVGGLHLGVQMETVFLTEQLIVQPVAGQKLFGVQGDSGSVVLDAEGRLLGLFIGVMVDETGRPREDGACIVSRISEVRKFLKITLL